MGMPLLRCAGHPGGVLFVKLYAPVSFLLALMMLVLARSLSF
jgi:hypothetical protein